MAVNLLNCHIKEEANAAKLLLIRNMPVALPVRIPVYGDTETEKKAWLKIMIESLQRLLGIMR